jgi:hypothetical protein
MTTVTAKKNSINSKHVGRCIYGSDHKGPYTKEHVVPLGMKGRWTLREASCDACREITKKFEDACLRRMFGPARYSRGITSKRHKDEHPTELPVWAEVNGVYRVQQIPLAEHPTVLFMEAFNPPGLFSGRSASDSARNYIAGIWAENKAFAEAKTAEELQRFYPEGAKILINGEFNPFMMARMLAKIAHGVAVFHYGLDGFRPFLLDIISGKDLRETFYYVGGEPNMSVKDTTPLKIGCGIERTTGYITVSIRLFANLGAPVYMVAVGDPTQETMEMLRKTAA